MLRLTKTKHCLFWRIVCHPTGPSVKTSHRLRIFFANSCTGEASVVTGGLSVESRAWLGTTGPSATCGGLSVKIRTAVTCSVLRCPSPTPPRPTRQYLTLSQNTSTPPAPSPSPFHSHFSLQRKEREEKGGEEAKRRRKRRKGGGRRQPPRRSSDGGRRRRRGAPRRLAGVGGGPKAVIFNLKTWWCPKLDLPPCCVPSRATSFGGSPRHGETPPKPIFFFPKPHGHFH